MRFTLTWLGTDDFYFCLLKGLKEKDIIRTLTEKGFDEIIFMSFY